MNREDLQIRREKLQHRTFLMMFRILIIFGIPAIGAYFLGKYLDGRFDMHPVGSLIAIVLALTISWLITVKVYKDITREFKELDVADRKEELEKLKRQREKHQKQKKETENKKIVDNN